jgi:P-type conjugative transfer protein TrbJ
MSNCPRNPVRSRSVAPARPTDASWRALALALAVGWMALLPTPAAAQFGLPGVPQIVYDPTAVGKLVTQLRVAQSQLQALRDNMRKLGSYNYRNIDGALAQIDAMTRQGQAISYSLANLDAQFRTTFPGSRVGATSGQRAADIRTQNERTLATIQGALAAARLSAQQFAVESARLNAIKRQIRSARSAQQIAELQGVVGVHTAEEITLLRQQLAAQNNAQQVYLANQVNRDLQGAAAARAFWRPGGSTPVRRKDMSVNAVGF